jgi:hypothetical protein
LEYLPTVVRRMHVRRCEQGEGIDDLLQFAENGRSAEVKPDSKMVRIEETLKSSVLRASIIVLVLYGDHVRFVVHSDLWDTHRIYNNQQKRDKSHRS